MNKIRLEIVGMSFSQSQSGAYALILGEVGGKRRLPIIIGGFEAQAIAIELEKMKPSRPLTHDLFKSFAENFGITLTEVIINKFIEGVFHAQLVCVDHNGEHLIDSRTSDAIALSLRFHCPVFTYEKILSAAGIVVDEKDTVATEEWGDDAEQGGQKRDYEKHTLDELEGLLQKSVENEEYEKASEIRDEIRRRKKK
ncbi:MAG: bifunctional nuclease family protein [Bacteroidales bacterium]|nr:bifunctional nuclease family protein [Bacteroidales bacterium]